MNDSTHDGMFNTHKGCNVYVIPTRSSIAGQPLYYAKVFGGGVLRRWYFISKPFATRKEAHLEAIAQIEQAYNMAVAA